MSIKSKKYGWRPDVPDQRDLMFAVRAKRLKITIPSKVDLRSKFDAVYDQGQLGSCTGNALSSHIFFNKGFDASRLFIYYNERLIENTVNIDAGAMIRDGIKALAIYGAPDETLWPYVISKFKTKPDASVYNAARANLIKSYHRIITLDDMRACLAEGYPFVTGFSVYESFESATVASTGVVPMPKKTEAMLGGHAVLVVGYDNRSKRFICRNSWGSGWGQAGYFTIPYAYLSNPNLANDMWSIR